MPRSGPWLPLAGNVLTCVAVLATALWPTIMQSVALAIRPAQFRDVSHRYSRALLEALSADARQRMWAIVIGSFLALLAVAVLAIILNRRAAKMARGRQVGRLAGPGWWASAGLLLGLALVSTTMLLSPSVYPLSTVVFSPSLSSLVGDSVAILFVAGSMEGLILSATAVRRGAARSPGSAPSRRDYRQLAARIGVVVTPLLLLAGFVTTGVLAAFIAAFLLFLVY